MKDGPQQTQQAQASCYNMAWRFLPAFNMSMFAGGRAPANMMTHSGAIHPCIIIPGGTVLATTNISNTNNSPKKPALLPECRWPIRVVP